MASSSKDRQLSPSEIEKGGKKSDPFLRGPERPIFNRAAGQEETFCGLNIHCEHLMENLDDLTEEQLDELLQDALDINKRLKAMERKQLVESPGEHLSDKMTFEENGSRGPLAKQFHFLPPLEQAQTSLVTRIDLLQQAKPDADGRRKKAKAM